MRLGNSQRFNYWLRWRVGWATPGLQLSELISLPTFPYSSQVFTIGTFIYYGGVAWNREQQDQYMTKTMVLLGTARALLPSYPLTHH